MRQRVTEFLRFCIVGLMGYFVDAGTLELLVHAGLESWLARVFSIPTALQCTYALHGLFTYRGHGDFSRRKWAGFMLYNLLGAAINYTIFLIVLRMLPFTSELAQRQGALFCGMAVALWFNYWATRHFVFRRADRP
ncbi:MAG: GtrA family protein [Rickettsiales bacterium]